MGRAKVMSPDSIKHGMITLVYDTCTCFCEGELVAGMC